MKVVGIDPSLASAGVAVVDGEQGIALLRLRSTGKAGDGYELRRARIARQAEVIAGFCAGADLIVIEGPSYGQAISASAFDRAGLWWAIAMAHPHVPIAVVPPKTRAKYATGSGASGKDEVLAAVIRRHLDIEVRGNDEADALILAAMGARAMAAPIDAGLPLAALAAMAGVAWPEDIASIGTETAPGT